MANTNKMMLMIIQTIKLVDGFVIELIFKGNDLGYFTYFA